MPILQYVQPTEAQKTTMQEFRDQAEDLYRKTEGLPMSRGRALALTKLEEYSMWVNKAITHND
jgi:hypothetical protein